MKISEIQKEVYQNAVDHGWYEDGERNLGEVMMLIVTEVAEAYEHYRNGQWIDEVFYTSEGKPDGLPIELADVIIRVLDFAEANDIDMEKAIQIKHEYNKGRPYRHGNKKA